MGTADGRRAAAGDLLTGVAHEVRNPLAAIQAAAEVLEQDLASEAAYAAPMGIICRLRCRRRSRPAR